MSVCVLLVNVILLFVFPVCVVAVLFVCYFMACVFVWLLSADVLLLGIMYLSL